MIELLARRDERVELLRDQIAKLNLEALFFKELHRSDAEVVGHGFVARVVKNEERTLFAFGIRKSVGLKVRLPVFLRHDGSRGHGVHVGGKRVASLGGHGLLAFKNHSGLLSGLDGSGRNRVGSK